MGVAEVWSEGCWLGWWRFREVIIFGGWLRGRLVHVNYFYIFSGLQGSQRQRLLQEAAAAGSSYNGSFPTVSNAAGFLIDALPS